MDGMKDRIGAAELIPDIGVLIASLFLPKFFGKFAGNPQYQMIAKSLSEQFMPDKSGRGFQDEVLLAEVRGLLEEKARLRLDEVLQNLTRGEKKVFIVCIALFAAKYQKESKANITNKDANVKDANVSEVIASLQPLTKDSPVVGFLNEILTAKDMTVEQTITLLRNKGMVKKSVADHLHDVYVDLVRKAGGNTDEALLMLAECLTASQKKREPMLVTPIGYFFACLSGHREEVRLIGATTSKKLLKGATAWLRK